MEEEFKQEPSEDLALSAQPSLSSNKSGDRSRFAADLINAKQILFHLVDPDTQESPQVTLEDINQ